METAIVLKSDPFSWKAIQAFKIASALSLKTKVYFITLKEGVYFLTNWSAEELGYENFKGYEINPENLTFVVEEDDFRIRNLSEDDIWVKPFKVSFKTEEQIVEIIQKANVVGVW